MRKAVIAAAVVLVLAVGLFFWWHSRGKEATDDAQVDAHAKYATGILPAMLVTATGVALVFVVLSASSRADDFEARKSYRYRYTPAEGHFVEQATDRLARGLPVLVILPEDVEVVQTLRLFLRMRMPDVAPADVFVMKGDAQELLGRLRGFRAGIVAFDKAWARPPSLVPLDEVPFPQGGGRALLVATTRQP